MCDSEPFDPNDPETQRKMREIWGQHKIDNDQTKELQQLLGEVVMNFGELEGLLSDALCYCVNKENPELGERVVAKLGFGAKVQLFEDLRRHFHRLDDDATNEKRVQELSKGMTDVARRRNSVNHCRWYVYSSVVTREEMRRLRRFEFSLDRIRVHRREETRDSVEEYDFEEARDFVAETACSIESTWCRLYEYTCEYGLRR